MAAVLPLNPYTPQADLGTPAADGAPVQLTIDGRSISAPAGTSILRAAALAGIDIPKLCATDSLAAFGSIASRFSRACASTTRSRLPNWNTAPPSNC